MTDLTTGRGDEPRAPLTGRALRRAWGSARTHAELGELTVRYLRGELAESPSYLGPTDPETGPIRDDLVALNTAGLVTTQSQPGDDAEEVRGEIWEQRAFVEAWCARDTAERLWRALERQGDVEWRVTPVASFRGRSRWWRRDRARHGAAAVTRVDGKAVTAIPEESSTELFDEAWGRWVNADAWDALREGYCIIAMDSDWGTRRVLWDTLRAALEVPGGC